MSRRRSRAYVVVGFLLIAVAIEWGVHGSEERAAKLALGLAAIALIWTIFLGAQLENVVERIAADVRRIANAVAPEERPDSQPPTLPSMNERKTVTIDGVEVDAPADMTIEEIREHRRVLHQSIDRARAELETLDLARARQAIAADMANAEPPWPADAIAFVKSVNDIDEIAALHRALGTPLTNVEKAELLQRMMQERLERQDSQE